MINIITANGTIASVKPTAENCGTVTVRVCMAYKSMGKGENIVAENYLIFNYNKTTRTKDISSSFREGQHVYVTGSLDCSVRKYEDGRSKSVLVMHMITMEPIETEFYKVFGMEGGHYPQDSQNICLEGMIHSIEDNGNERILKLSISENQNRYIRLHVYRWKFNELEKFRTGDRVCVCAYDKTSLPDPTGSCAYDNLCVTAVAAAEKVSLSQEAMVIMAQPSAMENAGNSAAMVYKARTAAVPELKRGGTESTVSEGRSSGGLLGFIRRLAGIAA